MPRRLDRQAQDGVIEGGIGVVDQVAIGIALDHGQPTRHTGVDAFAAHLDAAAIDVLGVGEQLQERAVAAADVEHARAGLDHFRDQQMVDPVGAGLAGGEHQLFLAANARPRLAAAAVRKPRMVANSSGSSSRKASWPLSDSISTKLTLAATALSACTISRLSRVGYSQSLVNETTQKRVLVPLKALASTSPCSAARSK